MWSFDFQAAECVGIWMKPSGFRSVLLTSPFGIQNQDHIWDGERAPVLWYAFPPPRWGCVVLLRQGGDEEGTEPEKTWDLTLLFPQFPMGLSQSWLTSLCLFSQLVKRVWWFLPSLKVGINCEVQVDVGNYFEKSKEIALKSLKIYIYMYIYICKAVYSRGEKEHKSPVPRLYHQEKMRVKPETQYLSP